MVNETLSSKNLILEILRSSESPVSGDEIASKINISRVAVWKAVQSLVESGYGIKTTRSGYQLEKDLKDSLFPWEFGKDENLFSHYTEIDSTMNEARHLAETHSNGGIQIVTADKQTKGKGHSNHKWTTTKGALAFTLITKNKTPVAASHRVVMASQIALAKVLGEISERRFFVRWPNDVWSEKGKVGGILDDISATGGICNWVNVGVGVNLSSTPRIEMTDCVFEKKDYARREVLTMFLEEFNRIQMVAQTDDIALANLWNSFCCDLGKTVKVTDSTKKVSFKGITGFGAAKLGDSLFLPGTISIIKN